MGPKSVEIVFGYLISHENGSRKEEEALFEAFACFVEMKMAKSVQLLLRSAGPKMILCVLGEPQPKEQQGGSKS